MERTVPDDGRRRLRRRRAPARQRRRPGIRGHVHRHGPPVHRHRRALGARQSRAAAQFRLSRHAPDGGDGQSDRPPVLRHRSASQLLQRLFDRRPPGADGGAALPQRLRRHRLGRARLQLDPGAGRGDQERAGHVSGSRGPANAPRHHRQSQARAEGRARRVRREGRRGGRDHRRSACLSLRSAQHQAVRRRRPRPTA